MQTNGFLLAPFADAELVRKLKARQDGCFEVLVRRHAPALFRLGRAYGYGVQDTEDLMSDAFLEAHDSLEGFSERQSFRTWLSGIMVEKCTNRLELFSETSSGDREYPLTASTYGPRQYEGNLDVHNLPVALRSTYILREVEGFSQAETATLLHTSETDVHASMQTAKAQLRSGQRRRFANAEVYPFEKDSCERIVSAVLRRV